MPDPAQYLSTAEVARVLGVGVSTVKRWVDEQILRAHRTPGGHRKLLLADVLRLAESGKFPGLDLGKLPGRRRNGGLAPGEIADDLGRALLAGDEVRARTLLHHAFYGSMPLTILADRVIQPAMTLVGHNWETSRIDVMHEHYATQIVFGILYDLKAELEDRPRQARSLALVGAPEGDPYLLGSLVLELVLLELGWEVVNLGPNTPLSSLARGLDEYRPRLLCISASYLPDPQRFRREYAVLYQEAERRHVPVALGGQALGADMRTGLPYTMFGDGMAQLAAFARTLQPPEEPPRRGRPKSSDKG